MIPRLTFRILLLALVAFAAFTATAAAATSAQIHRDAADGVIEGTYTLSELQAANRTVPAEQREYYGWDEAYSAAVRRLKNPDAPPPKAVPVDSNRNGTIDPGEKQQAAKKTAQVQETFKKGGKTGSSTTGADGVDGTTTNGTTTNGDDDPDTNVVVGKGDDDSGNGGDDEGGTSWLLALLIVIPLAIIGFGVMRMKRAKGTKTPPASRRRRRRRPSGGDDFTGGGSSSSYSDR